MIQAAGEKAESGNGRQFDDRTFVERHFGNILDFRLPQKHVLTAMSIRKPAARLVQAGSSRHKRRQDNEINCASRGRGQASIGREPMGVSFDKVEVDGAAWLKFDVQPAAHPTSDKDRAARLVDPGFGRVFTDHMDVVRYNQAEGWHGARVESRANFPLDPALAVLHYAQEIFEGLKAYNRDDGGVNLFRPDANARRFRSSAERMAMAPVPEPVFI